MTRPVKTLLDYYLCIFMVAKSYEFYIQQILTYHTLRFKSFHLIIIIYLKYISRLDFTNCNIIVEIGHQT